jgi:hypothetical protein
VEDLSVFLIPNRRSFGISKEYGIASLRYHPSGAFEKEYGVASLHSYGV